jgi:putative ABC transport system permease protein
MTAETRLSAVALSTASRIVALALRAYPPAYRARVGPGLAELFRDSARDEMVHGGWPGLLRLTVRTVVDIIRDARADRRLARAAALPHQRRLSSRWSPDVPLQDLRYALRGLRREPRFTLLVVLTLAVGIGANAAMFSVIDGVLLRPLPFEQPDELVRAYGSFSKNDSASISPPDFLDYRARNTVFASFAAHVISSSASLAGDGDAEQVPSGTVTANFFDTLGVAPALGRAFRADEETSAGADVVVLSDGLWRRRYGGDPSILGRAIQVDGKPTVVVGVMPPAFGFPAGAQLWIPIRFATPDTSVRRFHFLRGIARLAPGVTIATAKAQIDAIAKDLERTYPENETWTLRMVPLQEDLVGHLRPALLLLLAAVGVVLLIACGNVASLLLARALARRGEIAVRGALGASRSRLVRQLLTESTLLSAAGAAVGLLLARLLVDGLHALVPAGVLPLDDVRLDGTVLGFTIALAVATGILAGLAPAFQYPGRALAEALRSGRRTSDGRGSARLRTMLVGAQITLSLVLLVGASLMVESLWRLQSVDIGFDPGPILTAAVALPDGGYGGANTDRARAFYDELLARTRAVPGVRAAALVNVPPLYGGNDTLVHPEGRPPASDADKVYAQIRVASTDYFAATGIPIISGRAFADTDTPGSAPVVIINRTLAGVLFGDESPLGRRLVLDFRQPYVAEVIGVAGDIRDFGPSNRAPTMMFVADAQMTGPFAGIAKTIIVNTTGDPAAMTATIRAIVTSLDPSVPLARVATMEEIVGRFVAAPRFRTRLLGAFATVALLLSLVGLYGALSYTVSQRTREMGIRVALGARPVNVVGLVVRQGMAVVGVGLAIGLMVAVAAARLLSGLLYGVRPTDPTVYVAVTALLLLCGLVACAIPARRAGRVDPVVALRID